MRDTSDIKENRTLEFRPLVTQFRIEERWIDAPTPRREIGEAMAGKLAGTDSVATITRTAGAWKRRSSA
jgi:hypothetical protein